MSSMASDPPSVTRQWRPSTGAPAEIGVAFSRGVKLGAAHPLPGEEPPAIEAEPELATAPVAWEMPRQHLEPAPPARVAAPEPRPESAAPAPAVEAEKPARDTG